MTGGKTRIFVAGASGQLANSLCELAKAKEMDLGVFGRPALKIAELDSVEQSIASFSPDIVINAAAYTAVDAAENDEDSAYRANSTGPKNLALITARLKIPVVHISTDYVFDGTKPDAYSESDPISPLGVYGASKWAGEEAVRSENSKHLIIRTAWVFSPFGKNFVKTMLGLAETRDHISVVADQIGNPTYAPHLAEALLNACQKISGTNRDEHLPWGTFHLVGAGDASWADLAEATMLASAKFGGPSAEIRRISTDEFPTAAKRPANSRLNTRYIAEQWGISLPDWREGVIECARRTMDHRQTES
ncbi:MAG: dTDP-4-dehydrorhamnose reductase [Hyphomonas sp.]|nr:dTDP-4-dehydrorhamnose reductase [Hyphomonas sp.]